MYSQFDVNKLGVIFNNVCNDVQIRLGGWIQCNFNLVIGIVGVIFNEVNLVNFSFLCGYVEVVGDCVQVIIVNLFGVICDGCGFINVSCIMLMIGMVIMNNGNLDGFVVWCGMVMV